MLSFVVDCVSMIKKNDNISGHPQFLSVNKTADYLRAPHSQWSDVADNSHFVQFYENDAFLIKAIRKFIQSGDSAIVIVTPSHKERLEKGLEMYGLDLDQATEQGSYMYLDASETLSRFMIDGHPDPKLFFEVVGGVVTRASRNKHKVKAFGEMVALLWAEGNQQAAIELEELWNELQKIHSFSLFCAYPMRGFDGKDQSRPFEQVGAIHTHVLPSESYSLLVEESARLREIAILQQKAQSLEDEVARHKITEEKLVKSIARLKEMERRKDDFLSATSHELKTPLTSQKVFIQLLQRELIKNKEQKSHKYLTKIHEQTNKLTKLVNDLLDASKVQGGKLALKSENFDLYKCVKDCVEEIQATTENHKIYIKGDKAKKVFGDKDKISQVLINLLTNAVKYSPNGNAIYVNMKTTKK